MMVEETEQKITLTIAEAVRLCRQCLESERVSISVSGTERERALLLIEALRYYLLGSGIQVNAVGVDFASSLVGDELEISDSILPQGLKKSFAELAKYVIDSDCASKLPLKSCAKFLSKEIQKKSGKSVLLISIKKIFKICLLGSVFILLLYAFNFTFFWLGNFFRNPWQTILFLNGDMAGKPFYTGYLSELDTHSLLDFTASQKCSAQFKSCLKISEAMEVTFYLETFGSVRTYINHEKVFDSLLRPSNKVKEISYDFKAGSYLVVFDISNFYCNSKLDLRMDKFFLKDKFYTPRLDSCE